MPAALDPKALGLLLFLALLGLSLSTLYFLVEAPAARRARRARLASVQRGLVVEPDEETGPASRRRRRPAEGAVRLPGARALGLRLQQAGLETSAESLQLLCFSCATAALLLGVVLGTPLGLLSLVVAGAGAAPLVYVEAKRARRLSAFEEQFPEAIDLLARAVQAGHAFTTAFELIAKEMPEPVAGEFRIAFEQQNLALPLREALDALALRVPSPDVKVFVSALQIQRETGGNLAEILDKLAHVIRERFKLNRQVKVFTAEGRMSLFVLTAAPVVTAALLYLINRAYVLPLFVDPSGRKMLWTAVVLLVMGFLVIRRMTNLKI